MNSIVNGIMTSPNNTNKSHKKTFQEMNINVGVANCEKRPKQEIFRDTYTAALSKFGLGHLLIATQCHTVCRSNESTEVHNPRRDYCAILNSWLHVQFGVYNE